MVTVGIMVVCVIVYLLQIIPGLGVTDALLYAPVYSFGEFQAQGIPYEPWRMITAMFAHSTGSGGLLGSLPLHILLNMYTLWIFGQVLETMLGKGRYFALYMLAGLAGSLGVFLWSMIDSNTLTNGMIGASGAIFGLMAAYVVIQRRMGGNTTQLIVLIAINLVIGFLPGSGISWQAHLGGLIGGAILGVAMTARVGRDRRRTQNLLVGLVALIFVGIALSHAPILVG